MADMMASLGITLWSVFFLIPVGRGRSEERILPEQYEEVFGKLWEHACHQPYSIKTTEAPFYRRFVMNLEGDPMRKPVNGPESGRVQRAPLGVNDGKGVMFVSHTGTVYPSGFLPVACGKFPEQSIVEVYQNHPTFLALRDPEQLQGKCGDCEFNPVCGGSRARSYAVTGNILAQEPDCGYIPRKWRELACSA
jgi:radical SAM protein with 4Fe4S-binding SPASM domain